MKLRSFVPATTLLAAILTLSAKASLVVTYAESPDAVTSSLINTSLFNFDGLAANQQLNNVSWAGVGTYDKLWVHNVDTTWGDYGGAMDAAYPGGSPFTSQGEIAGVTVASTTLTLDSPSAYFGLWWSAGDRNNVMTFYNGDTLVAKFTSASLMDRLSSSYYGNPRDRTLDPGEKFAFINLYGSAGTTWDKIVLSNSSYTGFESDNHTSREGAWGTQPGETGPMPGIPLEQVDGLIVTPITAIPEPSGILVTGSVIALGLCIRRRSAL